MNLIELQRRMSEDVRRPLTAKLEMQPFTEDGGSTETAAARYIAPSERLTAGERLQIYNRSYWFRVIGAVAEDFPALSVVLGQKRFDAVVMAYLRENPSTSWTLRNLGAHLPRWLEEHQTLTGRRHNLAVDVARLEWAYVEAFDGRDIPPLSLGERGEIDADMRISLQPHLQLLQLSYPVDELVLSVHREQPENEMVSNASMTKKQQSSRTLPPMRRSLLYLAVHRYDNVVYYRRLEQEAFRLLTALRAGLTLSETLELAFRGSRLKQTEQAKKLANTSRMRRSLGGCVEEFRPEHRRA